MDLLDDLDDAFDDIFGDNKGLKPGEEGEGGMVTFGEMPPDLAELQAAIAGENIAPVQAILANVGRFKRAYFLAALHGAVKYVKGVENDPQRSALLQALYDLTLTKRGVLRQALVKGQQTQMIALASQLGAAQKDTVDHMRVYVQRLTDLSAIETQDVVKLFQVGLCSPERMLQAPMDEATTLSGLNEAKIKAVKDALSL